MSKTLWGIVVVIIILCGLVYAFRNSPFLAPFLGGAPAQQSLVSKVTYACDQGKAITASYYAGSTTSAAPGQPPTQSGSVALILSDGRSMTLPQTISGSGIRYANADESVVFWSKGNTAFVQEGVGSAATTTFSGCISASNISGQESWNTYASSTMGISVRYPQAYTLDPTHDYSELGPGKDIHGVSMIIPESMATGTNLGSDSYVAVEELPNAQTCSPSAFLDMGNVPHATSSIETITDNGTTYSVASSTGAGAGNRYEEWAWAIPGSSPCTAVRYFIHYGVLQNYPAGMVQQFNEVAVLKDFDGIRESLVLGK